MRFLPRDPREASPGQRTLWFCIWFVEWGVIMASLNGIAGFLALYCGKGGSDIALVVAAEMGTLTALGGWGIQVYTSKSKSRGPGQPDGRENGPQEGGSKR